MSAELTPSAFLAFYPQFSSFSQGVVLPEYLRQANARFSDFGEDTDEARRLYVAHKLTLYAASSLPEDVSDPSRAQLASVGRGTVQEVSSKRVGEVSVSYSSSAAAAGSVSTALADLKETVYGLQLLALLRLYGYARYVP